MPLDFAVARENMVENDVRTNDVTDRRLIAAMRAIAREEFVPAEHREIAYGDLSVPIGHGRYLLDPRTFSKLIQAAELKGSDSVLDIGCGMGYSALVLAQLAGRVIALEEEEALASAAARQIARAGARNVVIERGFLKEGARDHGPYDAIVIEGAVDEVPQQLVDQLKPDGRLLCVQCRGGRLGRAIRFLKTADALSGRALFDARVPMLPGFARPRAFVF